jgi:hypothetical protein
MPVAAFKPYFVVALPGINHSNFRNHPCEALCGGSDDGNWRPKHIIASYLPSLAIYNV